MILSRQFSFIFGLFFFQISQLLAQELSYPIRPNQKTYLFGNIGEIRSNHFHTGLDISAQTGEAVYASADGYVSRISVSPYGYGKVIYVMHPDLKKQTVYAHLDKFEGQIAEFVRKEQYQKETFEIDLTLTTQQISIKKGQIIAFSGNTGSSTGPHLHYEIRDLEDVALSPQKVGFSEIPSDNLPPILKTLAIVPLDIKSRVEGVYERKNIIPQKVGANLYQIGQEVEVIGQIGFEIFAYDVMNQNGSTFGLSQISIWKDAEKIVQINLDKISHTYNRSLNVFINYPYLKKTGKGFQRMYVADGNYLKEIYKLLKNDGKIKVNPNDKFEIKIAMTDASGNTSQVMCKVKGKKISKTKFEIDKSPAKSTLHYSIEENTLKVEAHHLKQKSDTAFFSFNGVIEPVLMAYFTDKKAVFLWDLRKGMPDFVEIGGERLPFYFQKMIPSQQTYLFENDYLHIKFPLNALFDTLYLEVFERADAMTIGKSNIPLFETIEIFWKKKNSQSTSRDVYYAGNSFLKSQKDSTGFRFKSKNLGDFGILIDQMPPEIKLVKKNQQEIRFLIADMQADIREWRATLNQKFILMHYEPKSDLLFSELVNKEAVLKGKFRLEVWDNAGNIEVWEQDL